MEQLCCSAQESISWFWFNVFNACRVTPGVAAPFGTSRNPRITELGEDLQEHQIQAVPTLSPAQVTPPNFPGQLLPRPDHPLHREILPEFLQENAREALHLPSHYLNMVKLKHYKWSMRELKIIPIFNDVSDYSKANCWQAGRKGAFSQAEFFLKCN